MNIVLLGPPGAGKGTQADLLQQELGMLHVASGELFRNHLGNETTLGLLAKEYVDRGDLVPDDITVAMVKERLEQLDCENGVILDGFPRTIPQADALSEMLEAMGRSLDGVFSIVVSEDAVVRRLSGRRICRDCQTPYHIDFSPPQCEGVCDVCGGVLYQRADDRPETVRNRLAVYLKQTAPLIDYYRSAGLLYEVDGSGDIETVNKALRAAIEELRKR